MVFLFASVNRTNQNQHVFGGTCKVSVVWALLIGTFSVGDDRFGRSFYFSDVTLECVTMHLISLSSKWDLLTIRMTQLHVSDPDWIQIEQFWTLYGNASNVCLINQIVSNRKMQHIATRFNNKCHINKLKALNRFILFRIQNSIHTSTYSIVYYVISFVLFFTVKTIHSLNAEHYRYPLPSGFGLKCFLCTVDV